MDKRTLWIELLGVTLSGAVAPDSGLIWTNLEGWWGLPDARGTADTIPGGHGRFPRTELFREARILTLTGHIYATNNRELQNTRDQLETALAAGVGVMRVATAASGIWERNVEIDTLAIDPDRGRRWTRFVVDIVAPDPRRYGPWQRVGPVGPPTATGGVRLPQRFPWNFGHVSKSGRLLVSNAGSIAIQPRIRITGGFDAVTVHSVTDGRRLRLEWPVYEGDALVLDSRTRRAEMGSAEVTRWLTSRQWFEILPGATHEYRFDVEARRGDPHMSAEYRLGAW